MTEQPVRTKSSAAAPLWILVAIVVIALAVGGVFIAKNHARDAKYRKYARSDCQIDGYAPGIDPGFDECVRRMIAGFKANGGVGSRY